MYKWPMTIFQVTARTKVLLKKKDGLRSMQEGTVQMKISLMGKHTLLKSENTITG